MSRSSSASAGWSRGERDPRAGFTPEEMAAMRRAARDEDSTGRRLFALLRTAARSVPFAEDAVAAWHCVRDPTTPPRVKGVLLGALAYFVLPVDLLPDFVPLMGFTDDAAVIATALATVAGALKPEHRTRARETLERL